MRGTTAPPDGPPGTATLQRGSAGWHSRGYMPHFDSPFAIQHVTYHLADSLPAHALAAIDDDLRDVPQSQRDVEKRRRLQAWVDAGHGSCVLHHPEVAEMVQMSFLHFDGVRYRLLAWVIMPNHVHALVQAVEG